MLKYVLSPVQKNQGRYTEKSNIIAIRFFITKASIVIYKNQIHYLQRIFSATHPTEPILLAKKA